MFLIFFLIFVVFLSICWIHHPAPPSLLLCCCIPLYKTKQNLWAWGHVKRLKQSSVEILLAKILLPNLPPVVMMAIYVYRWPSPVTKMNTPLCSVMKDLELAARFLNLGNSGFHLLTCFFLLTPIKVDIVSSIIVSIQFSRFILILKYLLILFHNVNQIHGFLMEDAIYMCCVCVIKTVILVCLFALCSLTRHHYCRYRWRFPI